MSLKKFGKFRKYPGTLIAMTQQLLNLIQVRSSMAHCVELFVFSLSILFKKKVIPETTGILQSGNFFPLFLALLLMVLFLLQKGFPLETTLDEVQEWLNEKGSIESIQMRKNVHRLFKVEEKHHLLVLVVKRLEDFK